MKQSEKLDLILRGLYEHKDEYWSVKEIIQKYGFTTTREELWRLTNRLRDDNFTYEGASSGDDVATRITTYGIEYCEESSYTYKGQSLITNNYNLSITDSPNATIVNNSQNVSITITNYAEVKNKITELRDAVNSNSDILESKRTELLECLDEVEKSVEAGNTPKFSVRGLVSLAADVATLAPLAIGLAKLLGVL